MAVEIKRRRFTVGEYYQMARAGILGEDDRVELLEGEIVEMTPIGHRHAFAVTHVTDALYGYRDVAVVRVQNPVHLDRYNEPQPDLVLARLPEKRYASGHPTAKDIHLLIEVAASSLEADRRVKVPLYARHRVREVWLVDLEQETITVYIDPTEDGYRTAQVLRRGEMLAPTAFPDRSLAVDDLLPQ